LYSLNSKPLFTGLERRSYYKIALRIVALAIIYHQTAPMLLRIPVGFDLQKSWICRSLGYAEILRRQCDVANRTRDFQLWEKAVATRIRGSMPALVTPFADGSVDFAALEALVEWHLEEGTHGLVPVGTTGESPTLSHDEHEAVVESVVKAATGRAPIVAGAGSNNTAEAIRLTKHAQKIGADAVLSVAPYYNRPTQEGLYRHFKAIHDATDIPLIIYNVPSRTIADIQVETIIRLAQLPRVIGVKDASADLARPALTRLGAGPDFVQLSGEDASALAFNADGGVGCISVTANVAPRLCAALQEATLDGDYRRARAVQDRLAPLHKAMFCEPSPGPAKYALSLLGKCRNEIRSPLLPVTENAQEMIRNAMIHAALI
jgi:4-hydroxy-tetrahydrodipicolinate synthase